MRCLPPAIYHHLTRPLWRIYVKNELAQLRARQDRLPLGQAVALVGLLVQVLGFHLTSSMTAITGLAGGAGVFIIGYFVYGRRRYGPRFIEVLPIAPACMVIAHACGRLGCFSAGCCYGQPTTSWLGLRFPHLDHAVVPTQLIEAGFLFLLFALLYHLAVRRDFKQTFVVYMVGYGLFRFCIEFIRGDERGALIGSLSPSQTLSLLLVAGSVGVYFLIARLVKDYETSTSLSNKIIPRPKTTPTSAISS